MMKFFRKYNKQMLAVFMTLLMIVFLGGSALEGMFNPSANRLVARSRLGDISFYDQQLANQATRLIEVMGVDWQRLFGVSGKPIQAVDWILLVREAEQFGTRAGDSTTRNWFQTDDQLDNVARRMNIKPARVLEAVADYRSIYQTAFAIADAAVPSEAAVETAVRDALESVQVNMVRLPAEAFVDRAYEPTEDQIEAQFEAYRSTEGGSGLNFGYYRQPAIKVQFIEIDRDAIAEQITLANLNRRAKSYFEERRTIGVEFRRPPDQIQPLEGLVGPPQDLYLSWEEAEAIAVEAVRKQQADLAAEQVANRMLQYTSETWLDVQPGEDGYKVAPANVAKLGYYDQLVERLGTYPDAVRVGVSDFFTRQEAGDVAGIGSAWFRPPLGIIQPFATLAFRTKVIVPKVPEEEGINAAEYLAPFQSCPYTLTGPQNGNVYLFRPIDGQPWRTAESVDEVREQVVADLRLLQGYETANARAESLRSCATGMALKEAYESDLDLAALPETPEGVGSGYVEPPPFSRTTRFQAGQGRPEAGVLVGGGVGQLSSAAVDHCFALEDVFEKTRVIEMKDRALVLLVEWVQTKPADVDAFNELREQLVIRMADARRREALAAWLDPDQIQARNGFELVGQ